MNLREVTVGRSSNCDIYLDPRCKYASSMHAIIYYDGNQLMFKDTSTNGTMINNVSVHKRAVPINRGDIIMISGKYQLNWNQIDSFFPVNSSPLSPIGTIVAQNTSPVQPAAALQPNLSKWSWAAFCLGWLWGPFNGCWWILFVNILLGLLSIIPIVGLFVSVCALGWNILCGVKGTQWAWDNKKWSSVQDFEQTQNTWNKVALVLFMVSIFILLISLIFLAVAVLV